MGEGKKQQSWVTNFSGTEKRKQQVGSPAKRFKKHKRRRERPKIDVKGKGRGGTLKKGSTWGCRMRLRRHGTKRGDRDKKKNGKGAIGRNTTWEGKGGMLKKRESGGSCKRDGSKRHDLGTREVLQTPGIKGFTKEPGKREKRVA